MRKMSGYSMAAIFIVLIMLRFMPGCKEHKGCIDPDLYNAPRVMLAYEGCEVVHIYPVEELGVNQVIVKRVDGRFLSVLTKKSVEIGDGVALHRMVYQLSELGGYVEILIIK